MELKIFDERNSTATEIIFTKKTVKDLLLQLNINSETVLVTKNNEILTEDEELTHNDSICILSVISGG